MTTYLPEDRLHRLSHYALASPELRRRLDTLAHESARLLGQPSSVFSVTLDTAQMVLGSYGLSGWIAAAGGMPVEWSPCAYVVLNQTEYVVENAAQDARERDNPLVVCDGLRSYAGVPIMTNEGETVGAHCVLGGAPRHFSELDLAVLRRAARRSAEILAAHRD